MASMLASLSCDDFDAGIYGDDELMLSTELEPVPSLKTHTTQVAALPPRNKLLAMAAELGRQAAEVQDKHRLAEEAQVLSQLTSCIVISFRSLHYPSAYTLLALRTSLPHCSIASTSL
jgi:hypothetical protein